MRYCEIGSVTDPLKKSTNKISYLYDLTRQKEPIGSFCRINSSVLSFFNGALPTLNITLPGPRDT